MKNLRFKPISFFLGVTALAVVGSAVSAQAETLNHESPTLVEAATTPIEPNPVSTSDNLVTAASETASTQTQSVNPSEPQPNAFFLSPSKAGVTEVLPAPQLVPDLTIVSKVPTPQPVPGSTLTSAATLTEKPEPSDLEALTDNSNQIAQTNLDPGRGNRSGSSYVGIGGNIGFTGDTSLGNGSFAILSKIGLTNNLSLRPAVLLGGDATFLIPLTYDFNIRGTDVYEPVRFAPYVGGGLIISTDDGNNIGFLLSGGVDVPLSRQFTATAGLNIGFLEDTVDPGLLLGIGYNIPNF